MLRRWDAGSFLVVEKYTELNLILRMAERVGAPSIGSASNSPRGVQVAGRSRGGYRSKFGLTVSEILADWMNCMNTTWQIASPCCTFTWAARSPTSVRSNRPSTKAGPVYVDLHRRGAGLTTLDVGGGYVDYDGSQTNFESSMNYTLQEYANDVVYHIQAVCEETGIPHPRTSSPKAVGHCGISQRAEVRVTWGLWPGELSAAASSLLSRETSADFENLPKMRSLH
ncbi:MAG: hypothetical protein R3C02_06395 [Planctomycetaceae bacterium]